jgi:hypothetical protein
MNHPGCPYFLWNARQDPDEVAPTRHPPDDRAIVDRVSNGLPETESLCRPTEPTPDVGAWRQHRLLWIPPSSEPPVPGDHDDHQFPATDRKQDLDPPWKAKLTNRAAIPLVCPQIMNHLPLISLNPSLPTLIPRLTRFVFSFRLSHANRIQGCRSPA